MAVDIFNPPGGSPLGPGIPYQVLQLPAVAITPPGRWEIGIWDNALPNTPLWRQYHFFQTSSVPQAVGTFGITPEGGQTIGPLRTLTRLHDEVTLRARLLEQDGAVLVDESSLLGVWDSSYQWTLPASATGSGFSQADRDDLKLVKSSVWADFGLLAGAAAPIPVGIIDTLRGPPRSVLTTQGALLLEGRGTIPVLPPNFAWSFGGTWTWFRVPPGVGFSDGTIKHYSGRVLQLQVIRQGSGFDLYTDLELLEDAEGGHVLWKWPFPTQIAFDLPPVWQAQWQWLV